jgi:hypothetical protein
LAASDSSEKLSPGHSHGWGFSFPQQRQQLCDIRRYPPRFVAREQLAGDSSAGLILAIREGECLPVVVADDEARRGLFDGPGRREAAICHHRRVNKRAASKITNVPGITRANTKLKKCVIVVESDLVIAARGRFETVRNIVADSADRRKHSLPRLGRQFIDHAAHARNELIDCGDDFRLCHAL